jgi:hypothetical protein
MYKIVGKRKDEITVRKSTRTRVEVHAGVNNSDKIESPPEILDSKKSLSKPHKQPQKKAKKLPIRARITHLSTTVSRKFPYHWKVQ